MNAISEKHSSTEQPELKKRIFQTISEKDGTSFDFWQLLLKYKTHSFHLVDLVSPDGLNIIQFCIDKGKLSFLTNIVYTGWWKILSQQKVPESSSSEHKGRTAKDIAESKKVRKPLDEYKNAEELENSLSPLLKSVRNGDKTKVNDILRKTPQELYYTDCNGGNALNWAIVSGHLEIFKDLLALGVDCTIHTRKRENLLHVACLLGRTEFIPTILKECNLNLWLEDTGHKTPLDRFAEVYFINNA